MKGKCRVKVRSVRVWNWQSRSLQSNQTHQMHQTHQTHQTRKYATVAVAEQEPATSTYEVRMSKNAQCQFYQEKKRNFKKTKISNQNLM
jgi:hypothetical protein